MESLNSNSQERELHQLQQMQVKAKESCMAFFWQLHSFLEQDVQTFTRTTLLNLDQLEKHLSEEEFQELESFSAFRVLLQQFQTFLYSGFSFDNDEGLLIRNQKREALDVGLIVTEFSRTKSDKQETSSRSRNDTHAEDVDIKPVNDKEPMAKTIAQLQKDFLRMEAHCVNMELKYQNQALKDKKHSQILNETSNKAKIKKEIKVLETINIELEHSMAKLLTENDKLHKENKHLKQTYKDLYDSIKMTRVQTKDHNDSLIAQINNKTVENIDLKARIQKKVFANVAFKNELRKLKVNSVDTKFAKPSILGKPVLQPPRNQSVVRQPNAFKSEGPNFSKPRFASQVDVNSGLPKPALLIIFLKLENLCLKNPIIDDWDHLFQPMFDAYFNPPTFAVSPVLVDAAPRVVDLADSPVSTSIDHDGLSTSIPSTQKQEHSPNISQEKSKLDEDLQGKPVDAKLYRGMIGSLMYLTSSKPNLTYAICLCAQHQTKPTEKHLNVLADYGFQFNKIPMYRGNKSAIAICCNNVQHSRAKHIDVRYHFIKEQVENGIMELFFVRTEYQLADIFTKPLPREKFNFLIEKLGMRSISSERLKRLAEETDELWW
nr:retrotransposon protein, putative, unclassified [Tanacetum cinerariifolium]